MGYNAAGEGDLDRVFITNVELVDQFIGEKIYSWGSASSGALGDNTTVTKSSPSTISGGGTTWSQISSGYYNNVALKTDGTLWTWGVNNFGQLGDGTTSNRSSPVTVAGGGTNWSVISCGYQFAAGIKTDGSLWTWGINNYGQLGDGTTSNRSSPVSVIGGNNWKHVACGTNQTVAIKTDGTLWTWGTDIYGALGNGTTTSRSSPGTTTGGGTDWKSAAAGQYSSAAIKTDGTLWTWGYNGDGALMRNGDGTSPGQVYVGGQWKQVCVSTGYRFAIGLKMDGTIWKWGHPAVGAGGSGNITPILLPGGINNWKQISAGGSHALAVRTDGQLYAWGLNDNGQLGIGEIVTSSTSSPVRVVSSNINNWKTTSGGYRHSVAIYQD